MLGILNIYKPKNVTSNYIVSKVKKKLNTKKVGHFGTLDPLASGVLPIAVGKATKLFDYFLNKEKVYIATFEFGYQTDTLDSQGKVEAVTEIIPNEEEIKQCIIKLEGRQEQMPPKFSAKNINGCRAYDMARKGIEFELKSKEIEIYQMNLIEKNGNSYKFYIRCSAGTYIRSIARDMAHKLNSLATMTDLTREKSGCFKLENAIDIEKVENLESCLMTIEEVLPDMPRIYLDDSYYDKLTNGMTVKLNHEDCDFVLVYSKGELFGIATIKDNYLKVNTNLKE